jgi:hypothetical protein
MKGYSAERCQRWEGLAISSHQGLSNQFVEGVIWFWTLGLLQIKASTF